MVKVLVIVFTQDVMAQERLFIECYGEAPYSILDMMVKVTQQDRMLELERRRLGNSLMQAVLEPSMGRKDVALVAQEAVELDFWVIPTGGQNLWKFSTMDNKPLPTNTNDGIEQGFDPVEQVEIRIEIDKSPPRAAIPGKHISPHRTGNLNPMGATISIWRMSAFAGIESKKSLTGIAALGGLLSISIRISTCSTGSKPC